MGLQLIMANKINTNINALNAQIAGKQFERKLENTMLKLSLAKHLAILEQQSYENQTAKENLQNFIDGVRRSLADGDVDL